MVRGFLVRGILVLELALALGNSCSVCGVGGLALAASAAAIATSFMLKELSATSFIKRPMWGGLSLNSLYLILSSVVIEVILNRILIEVEKRL